MAQYLRILLRNVWLIGLLGLGGLLAGLAYSYTRPTMWQSTVTLIVKPAPVNLNISSQSLAEGINPAVNSVILPELPVRSLPSLVNNNLEVERAVQEKLAERIPEGLREPGSLMSSVTVQEVQGRPNILEVNATVRENAELSRLIANTWAEATVESINSLVGAGYFNAEQAAPELEAAARDAQQSERALIDFEERSDLTGMSSRLAQNYARIRDYSQLSNQIQFNLENTASLRRQLQDAEPSEASSLPLLLLSLSSFTAQASDVDVLPFLPGVATGAGSQESSEGQTERVATSEGRGQQGSSVVVQPTLEALSALTPREQTQFVDSLRQVLERRQSELTASIGQLTKESSSLRAGLERVSAERERLVADRDNDQRDYQNLATLIKQQQVSSRIQSGKVAIAAPAVDPVRADLRGLLLPLLGGIAGLLLGIAASFAREFLGKSRSRAAAPGGVRGVGTAAPGQ